jgi:carbonic anhydrase/acetyltransferase-like protein (isoleucine patch superfamily)
MSITILPRFVGELVTVAHRAIVHACTIDDEVLIGMGAIILDGAEIGARTIIGANALVTLGKKIPPARSSLVPPQKSNAGSLAKNRKTSRGGPGVTSKSQNISANSTRPVAALYERRIF